MLSEQPLLTISPYIANSFGVLGLTLLAACAYFLKKILDTNDKLVLSVTSVQVEHAELKVRVDSLEETVDEHEKALNHLSSKVCPSNGQAILTR